MHVRHLARWLAIPLLAVSAASCLDGPTGPLTLGELRLRATFTPGEDPSALGLTIDSMRVTATRRNPIEPVVDTVLPYSVGATHAWLIDLAADPESFDARVELYGGVDTLYAGTATPAVRLGFADGRAEHDVLLDYVGAPVTSPIDSIVVRPARVTLAAIGATHPFTAEALDASGAVIPGVTFAWGSSQPAVATIDQASGMATAVSEGATTITASAGGVSGGATLTVDLSAAAGIVSVTVSPATATLTSAGATQAFEATAYDAAGDLVGGVTFAWSSSNGGVAVVDGATGIATAAAEGTTRITASVGTVSGDALLTVDLGGGGSAVASIVVTPPAATLTSIGATQQFTAEALDALGQPVSGVTFAWSSSVAAVASVDPASGVAIAVSEGTTTIVATLGGVSGTASLTVDTAGGGGGGSTIDRIAVTPAAATLDALGATQQFGAQAFDSNGDPIAGVTFDWSSDAPGIATIDQVTGIATALADGTTTIRATAAGVTGTASLTVDVGGGGGGGGGIARIVVTPAAATLGALGETQQFVAQALDSADTPVAGVSFAWSTNDGAVATIDATTGLATAVGNGQAIVTATAGGVSGTATLDVDQRVARIAVSPDTVTFNQLRETAQFSAAGYDANGNAVAGLVVTWSSSAPQFVGIDAVSGLATAIDGLGVITITATGQGSAAGVTGTAVVLMRP